MPPTASPRSGSRRVVPYGTTSPARTPPWPNCPGPTRPAGPSPCSGRSTTPPRTRSPATIGDDAELLLDLVRAHPLVQEIVPAAEQAVHLDDLAAALFPEPASGPVTGGEDERITFLTHLVAALSHVRAVAGRAALSVDLHLWVRELTRIDRVASSTARYRWSDDGALTEPARRRRGEPRSAPSPPSTAGTAGGPAGASSSPPSGADLDTRRHRASGATTPRSEGRFRALHLRARRGRARPAPATGRRPRPSRGCAGSPSRQRRAARRRRPTDDDPDYRDGWVLPVLTHGRPGRRRRLQGRHLPVVPAEGRHPLPRQRDRHPAVGHAVHAVRRPRPSTPREKKALVFTDSVQDAAHRAGFVREPLAHADPARAAAARGRRPAGLARRARRPGHRGRPATTRSGATGSSRPTSSTGTSSRRSGSATRARDIPARVRTRVRRRLLFDAVLEFGLQSRVGRTLELTGSAVVEVDAGEPAALARIGPRGARRHRRPGHPRQRPGQPGGQPARGVGARRARADAHAGRHRARVVPELHPARREPLLHLGRAAARRRACPRSRGAAPRPRSRGSARPPRARIRCSTRSPRRSPGTRAGPRGSSASPPADGARLARQLLERLARADVLHTVATEGGGTVFAIPASAVVVSPAWPDELAAGRQPARLRRLPDGSSRAPPRSSPSSTARRACCVRCPGTLHRGPRTDNFYRRLYASTDMRRIVAREHTSLLDDETRLRYESEFKQSVSDPQRAERARRHADPGDGHRHR